MTKKIDYLTTGQLAKSTGITVRTLRYYDQIGLLIPQDYGTGSTRLYTKDDIIRLQRIQVLKYLGLSLQEIQDILNTDTQSKGEIRHSLQAQLDVIYQKIAHMVHVVRAIQKIMELTTNGTHEFDIDQLVDVIQTIQMEQNWGEQYRTASLLQSRINLYDKFSTNPLGWHRWVFNQLKVCNNDVHVLELGCGDGTFWVRNAEVLPSNWRITLTDISIGMVEEARCNLAGREAQFKFLAVDTQQIPFHDGQFDLVIANNMLYHVPDMPRALQEMNRVLKPGGVVCLSTMSTRHLQEIDHLAAGFDSKLRVLDDVIYRFHLDNGERLLSDYFKDIQLLHYEDRLLVTEAETLINYMISTPMIIREKLSGDKIDEFRTYINQALKQSGVMEMTKENGIFLGRK